MSRRVITALVVIALLAAIGVINYMTNMDPTQLAARGVGRDPHSHGDEPEEEPPMSREDADFVAPIGPEDAPVKIIVCYQSIGYVRDEYRRIAEGVASDYGELLRIEFMDSTKPENREFIGNISSNLRNGLIIDGEVVKQVPGSAFGMVSFSGSPQFEEWSVAELRMAIEHDLTEKGIEFASCIGDEPPPAGHEGHGHQHEYDENDRIPH
jgi:hypothetical protein